MIREKVIETIKEYEMFKPEDKCIVGVSGGADSIALLHVLNEIKTELGINLHVVHLNHRMRGGDADGDEEYVRSLTRKMSLPVTTDRIDVVALAEKWKVGTEEAGRRARYDFYERLARDTGSQKIALGHTADDNIETFMMRLLRGAGMAGLCGIPPVRGKIVRPLILAWRREVEKYCASVKLVPRIDYTNYESKYLRNRVRNKLIPDLRVFNPNVKGILLQTVLLLTSDHYYILEKAREAFSLVLKKKKEESLELEIKKLLKLDPAIIGHVLRLAILAVKGNLKDISFIHIHDVQDKLGASEKKEINLPGGIYVFFKRDTMVISASRPAEAERKFFNYLLPLPGEVVIKEANLKISTSVVPASTVNLDGEPRPYVAYVDRAFLPVKLYVRSRRSGDRFTPLGVRGTKKIQDFFVDEKIPQEKRDAVPLVEGGGEIVWVVGHRIDEKYKVTSKTRSAVQIKAEPL